MVCFSEFGADTRSLGRAMLEAVLDAGVFHAYLENVIFNTDIIRMHELVEAGAIGRPLTFRAREGHSGPHAPHFWDAGLAGGGALLDMASHGAEAARYLFGKETRPVEVVAWGATLVHGEKTTGEDNAIMIVRFADGRAATCDVSWSSKGGLEGRFELYGDAGRLIEDMAVGSLRAFIERPAGYLAEKADAETGWVFPVPDEVRVHGHDLMMADVVGAYARVADICQGTRTMTAELALSGRVGQQRIRGRVLAGFAQPAAAPRFSRTKEGVRGPAAKRGQHTDEVLGERGFSSKEISELKAAGVIGPQQ